MFPFWIYIFACMHAAEIFDALKVENLNIFYKYNDLSLTVINSLYIIKAIQFSFNCNIIQIYA